ncbi:MAG: hypothetical protein Q4A74_02905 [Cardiobacteriaceae bacterium]|nr:hypothetical protein [Cardiobacteriaceae bacterium]
MKIRSYLLLPLVLALVGISQAAPKIDFGKIASKEQAFKQYWQLNEDEVRRYETYMAVVGKFRNQNLDPLTVLSMISDTQEDKAYYAKKAAEMEHEMVKREIETAWLISEAMGAEKLDEVMQEFTDRLTGINTIGYVPYAIDTSWHTGDTLLLIVDDRCLNLTCIKQFAKDFREPPAHIMREVVVNSEKEAPLSNEAQTLIATWPNTTVTLFDPIEHSFIDESLYNQPQHIRNRTVLKAQINMQQPEQNTSIQDKEKAVNTPKSSTKEQAPEKAGEKK